MSIYWPASTYPHPVEPPAEPVVPIVTPLRGLFVMPCAECDTMLHQAGMRYDPIVWARPRVVCTWCASR